MIAIFTTETDAVDFSNNIHALLKKNRADYNAEKWSEINKSDNAEKWCVMLPVDYKEIGLSIEGVELIDKLPDNWKNETNETI